MQTVARLEQKLAWTQNELVNKGNLIVELVDKNFELQNKLNALDAEMVLHCSCKAE